MNSTQYHQYSIKTVSILYIVDAVAAGSSFVLMALCACALPLAASAEPRWIRAHLGSFESISDDGRNAATQALSQFAQFSFALGTVLGKPELRLDPPLRIIVFKNSREMQAQCPVALHAGRDRIMACTTVEGQLPPSLLREFTRTLLENNFASMPPDIERGLETFFSTVQSTAVHVTWGAPPPVGERTREWALLHRIITQPDYSGKAKIYLHNLAAGMEKSAASRNAFAEEGPKFDADVDQYFAAGVFAASAAPARPLNPDRDFNTTSLTSDEGVLMRADLLGTGSEAAYESLLASGKQVVRANEGLGILALRKGDDTSARRYIEEARRAGTKNFALLTEYAGHEQDPLKAVEILKEALTAEPKYAPAHWVFGEKVVEPARRLAEWKQAVTLAPRNYEWLAKYAELCMSQKQYAEAGRAWMAASLAAPDVRRREQFLTAREQISQVRLEAEDAERRKENEAKLKEINQLKANARNELAQLEARVNTRPLSAAEIKNTVDWFDTGTDEKVTGDLVRVDCTGKQLRLNVKDGAGKILVILVRDPGQLVVQGGIFSAACGVQKPRRIVLGYKVPGNLAKGVAGEATGLEFIP